MKKVSGFTLLEVILSLAISGMVLLAVYSGFRLYIEVGTRVENRIDRDARKILTQLSRDLRSAYSFPGKSSGLGFTGSAASIKFVTVVSLKHNFASPEEYDLREVSYFLGPGSYEGVSSLIYKVNLTPGEGAVKRERDLMLSNQVQSLRFTYYDGKAWQKGWNSTEQLPRAVRIFIELKAGANSSIRERFSTIVDVPGGREQRVKK